MNYSDCYNNIKENFLNAIVTSNEELKKKIYSTLMSWFSVNYEEDLKKAFEEKDEKKINLILKNISDVCELNDLNKVKHTYIDNNFQEICKLSDEIFSKALELKSNSNYSFTNKDYDNYISKLNFYISKVSPIFLEDSRIIISECELDLNYLRNNGNVDVYSVRLSPYV